MSSPPKETFSFAQTPEGLLQKAAVVNVHDPEAVENELVVVGRQDGRAGSGPDGVDVLHDDHRLAGRPAAVEKDGDLLGHRIRSQKQLALLPQLILQQLRLHSLEAQHNPHLTTHGIAHPAMSFTSAISSPLQAVASSPLRTLL
ncbi:unnamed protein product [Musa acuminata subsp. malaccensis]|uniref:(wild Malaysian banana) hypothetical protein n=1 Tax=Musa acuminata subsp. malaccensis TaxID=214687 RepID=A0A8D7B3M9_MUSAM|nr:unnamed protein product [Musa acuminata subsp. malaccensis]